MFTSFFLSALIYATPLCEERAAAGYAVTGPDHPYLLLSGYDADHRTSDVTVQGVFWNGREVSETVDEKRQSVGRFADPARFVR